jgi:fatty-acyl-CoA synthase
LYNPDLGTEEIVLVAETEELSDLRDPSFVEKTIRASIVAELGVAPRAIYLKPPRWIVKSTAGKPARSATREKLMAEHPELRISLTNKPKE